MVFPMIYVVFKISDLWHYSMIESKIWPENLGLCAILKNRSAPWKNYYFEETKLIKKLYWRSFFIWAKICDPLFLSKKCRYLSHSSGGRLFDKYYSISHCFIKMEEVATVRYSGQITRKSWENGRVHFNKRHCSIGWDKKLKILTILWKL